MKIYNYDDDGYFTSESEADESPLEPGVFLIPAKATDVKPPKEKKDHRLRFVDGAWTHEKLVEDEEAEEVISSPPKVDQKIRLLRLVNQVAIEMGFLGYIDAISFKDDPNAEFADPAQKIFLWRSKALSALPSVSSEVEALSDEDFKGFWTGPEYF